MEVEVASRLGPCAANDVVAGSRPGGPGHSKLPAVLLRLAAVAIFGVAVFAAGIQIGKEVTKKSWMKEAIHVGAARWAREPESGKFSFYWTTKRGKRSNVRRSLDKAGLQ